jgi:hypothetical protein
VEHARSKIKVLSRLAPLQRVALSESSDYAICMMPIAMRRAGESDGVCTHRRRPFDPAMVLFESVVQVDAGPVTDVAAQC